MHIISVKLGQHFFWGDEFGIVVFQRLVARDVADRTECSSAKFTRALRDLVGHGEELVGVIIQHQVVIAKVASSHVPVKVLRLHVEGEDVGEQGT